MSAAPKDVIKAPAHDLVPELPPYLPHVPVLDTRPNSPDAIEILQKLGQALVKRGGTMTIRDMTSHYFCEGLYARQWAQAAGVLAVSKIHSMENFLVLLAGECVISTGEANVHLVAPCVFKTVPGVKRAVLSITDCWIMTFHPNPDNERDVVKLEERYTIPEPPPEPDSEPDDKEIEL